MADVPHPATAADPGMLEQPTSSARLRFSVRPAAVEGTAEGTVPAVEAHALITTFGMIAMGVAGITGATATVDVAPARALAWFLGLALAELGLALVVILLIARRDHPVTRRPPRRSR